MGENMTTPTVSLGDAMLMCHQGNYNNNGWNSAWQNPFMYLIWLAMFGGYGGGLFGNRADAAAAGAITEATLQNAIYSSNAQQDTDAMIRSLGNGIADLGYALNNSIKDAGYANVTATKDVGCNLGTAIANSSYATNDAIKDAAATNRAAVQAGFTNMAQDVAAGFTNLGQTVAAGFANNAQNLVAGFNGVNANLTEGRFGMQAGFTALGNQIESLKYENAQNTCALKTAMHEEGEATRALIQANTVQALRDKLAEQGSALQAANFQISQLNQNATIINALKANCGCGCGC